MRPLLSALSALVLLSGCPSPPCAATARTDPSFGLPEGNSWSYDSERAEVSVGVSFSGACDPEDGPRPESVQAEVLSPSNAVLPSEVVAADLGNPFTASAIVRFMPTEGPGTYLVTVTFLPVGGRQSVTRLIVADRRTEPPTLELPGNCSHVSVMRSGTVVCDGVARFPSGQTQDVCSGAAHMSAGSTLWSYDGSTLTAFQEQDGGFQARRTTSTMGGGHVLVDEHRAFLVERTSSFPRVHRVMVEDTVPATPASLVLPGNPGAMAVKGDILFVANVTSTPDDFGLTASSICAFDVSGSSLSQIGCQDVPGEMVGAADGTFVTNQGNTLRAFSTRPDGTLLLVDTLTLPPGMSPIPLHLELFTGNWAHVSNLGVGSLVVRMKGGALHPEQYSLALYGTLPEYSWAAFPSSTKLWRNDPQ
jgi:hypothetical protein